MKLLLSYFKLILLLMVSINVYFCNSQTENIINNNTEAFNQNNHTSASTPAPEEKIEKDDHEEKNNSTKNKQFECSDDNVLKEDYVKIIMPAPEEKIEKDDHEEKNNSTKNKQFECSDDNVLKEDYVKIIMPAPEEKIEKDDHEEKNNLTKNKQFECSDDNVLKEASNIQNTNNKKLIQELVAEIFMSFEQKIKEKVFECEFFNLRNLIIEENSDLITNCQKIFKETIKETIEDKGVVEEKELKIIAKLIYKYLVEASKEKKNNKQGYFSKITWNDDTKIIFGIAVIIITSISCLCSYKKYCTNKNNTDNKDKK